jgi:hypothetical protein
MLDDVATGRSGVSYRFDLVVQGASKSKYGFLVLNDVTDKEVVRLFVKQFDTEMSVYVMFTTKVMDEARALAKLSSISLVPINRMKGFEDFLNFQDAFRVSRILLLEVNPSSSYGGVLRGLIEA